MRILFFLPFAALLGLYCYFYIRRSLRCFGVDTKKRSVQLCLLAAAVLLGLSSINMQSLLTLLLLHTLVLSLLARLLQLPFRRFRLIRRIYESGLVPLALSLFAILFGYFHIQDVQATHYTVQTDGIEMRIVFLSDLHYPNAMTPARLQEYCDEITAAKPDLVLLGGDIVDEGTTAADLKECFAILGSIESTHGSYFVCGNHDGFSYGLSKGYDSHTLAQTLEENNIVYLADESVSIGNLTLIGRKDRSDSTRAELSTLLPKESQFVLVLDHQPLDAEETASYGCDLMLSGHTHNGQIWPLGYVNALLGPKYGRYEFGDMELIVSSGIAGWGYPVRTQGVSEYVILDLIPR